jgi:hypothetical protein
MANNWLKIAGTQAGKLWLGLTGVLLKNNSGNLDVRNNADTAYAAVQASKAIIYDNTTSYTVTVQPSDSATGSYALTLPTGVGSANQVLQTDGTGVLSWASAASTASNWKVHTTTLAYGAGATVQALVVPAGNVIQSVIVIVDTAFNATGPSLTVGISGTTSKYVVTGDTLLTVADRYEIPVSSVADGSDETVNIYYTAGSGGSAGSARVLITYATPSTA